MKKGSVSASDTISKVKESLTGLANDDIEKVASAIKTALKLEKDSISEMKYEHVAKRATEIIKNKKVNIPEEQMSGLQEIINKAIKECATEDNFVTMHTKHKPFVDIVIEPFKFILSAANLPLKLVKSIVNILTSGI